MDKNPQLRVPVYNAAKYVSCSKLVVSVPQHASELLNKHIRPNLRLA